MPTPFARALLACGALAAILYIGTDIACAAWFYPGYDYTSQQVSELSAIGAPSRPIWVAMGYAYAVLNIGCAAGIWAVANGRNTLRAAAVLIVIFALNGLFWPPMHMRGTEVADTDTLHIVFTVVAVVLMVAFIGLGASALGRGFRIYSIATILAMLAAGGIVGTQVPAIAAGLPTPWMGLLERVGVYGPLIWLGVLGIALMDRARAPADSDAAVFAAR